MLCVHPIEAFQDNYIWAIRKGDDHCIIVDPGDAAPVVAFLQAQRLRLAAILLTHHHVDHIGGVATLVERYHAEVYGPVDSRLPPLTRALEHGARLDLPVAGLCFQVIAVPGHTRSHIAYFGHGTLFCGDTLFSLGCGRLFEGTAEQMQQSLDRLAALPANTRVYCAHEYTQANCRFASMVDPDNAKLQARKLEIEALRAERKPTLPSTLAAEIACNPFLRSRAPAIIAAANRHAPATGTRPERVLGSIRNWKDQF